MTRITIEKSEFKELVKEGAKLGAYEAIALQKKECMKTFDRSYVAKDDCFTRQKDVHTRIGQVGKRINRVKKRPHLYELQPEKPEPDATITFNLSDHFKLHWFKYVAGTLILLILSLLGYNVMGS